MTGVGTQAGPYTAVAPFELPEVGAWFLADEGHEGRPVWLRLVGAEQGRATARDVATMHDRLRHLAHPSIPEVVFYDEIGGQLALAAPVGVPMSELLRLRGDPEFVMTPATVLDLACELADVLVQAHERGRPHGFLSPSQVWLTQEGNLVVWGFGSGPDTQGDLAWYPPERARGKRPSGDADQWALGAITAALITGRTPWRGPEPLSEAKVGDASHLYLPVVEQWKPLGRVLQRALSVEPRDRFPSAHPVRQALVALHQRVQQPSDRATLGAELHRRFGAELPVRAAIEAPVVPSTSAYVAPLSSFDRVDPFDADTVRGTSPTVVPPSLHAQEPGSTPVSPDAEPADELPEPLLARPLFDDPPSLQPLAPDGDYGPVSSADAGPVELGDLEVAERVEAVLLPGPRDWMDIRRIAPFVVGAMVVLLFFYLLAWGG
jgi:serine/threonine protein kinase